jgi:hypothetical protein
VKRREFLGVAALSTATMYVVNPLSTLIDAVRRIERFLGPEDTWVSDSRRILYECADSVLRPLGFPTVREKGPADYVVTAHATANVIERVLDSAGYQRNVLSTRKYRTHHSGGKQWAVGSWVYDPADTDWQHHVYLFEAPDGGTDIYAHRETSVREGLEHRTDTNQTHGDPNGRVRRALDAAGIDYGTRNF